MSMTYKIIGASVGTLFIGTTFLSLRKRNRDIRTSKLMTAIQAQIQPITSGLNSQNAFDIHFLNKVLQSVNREVLVLKTSTASRYADQIHKAWGSWYQGGDDEEQVYGVFRQLKDKVQVSQVAKAYQETYSKNLIDTLKDRFDKQEITIVLNIVKALPNYRTA
ncbi:hypothetical protein [Tenacibaculum aquimarinum]|uniref:hypothetical protein n=1 Tax=Tenacibaculum aquimarinum TaxID=2910675 RepID=UPI001F0AC40F|nr:hypothetical protein [Tenacibaculum aquimarinum]MCH3884531.1 hypothetical protein [Tenacibaculum aquimarinum]